MLARSNKEEKTKKNTEKKEPTQIISNNQKSAKAEKLKLRKPEKQTTKEKERSKFFTDNTEQLELP